ncbi:uncharacterized protein LOC113358003 isoform X1 [Papaver somniferum]|uniref:uncharacterized protein LOC113358003 isoform X1 n=2 Tax=Papaver somniferum TaxID=3469 RepID=UPI000E701876|nr:uncharacterized protein LOC113358003 isoform X1 [Papaver somniferum]XP_026457287.1 uncharacterized protein LOC113358003 isoform X1 [Papaver somniferum]
MMGAGRKIIAICMSGGGFVTSEDGTLLYSGGEAHAIDIDQNTAFDDFRAEISEMWNCNNDAMSIKYFLPGNKRTLITISNDKDLKRMINFHGNSTTADVYVVPGEAAAQGGSVMPASRSSRTTTSKAVVPVIDVPMDNVLDIPPIVDIPVDKPADDTLYLKHHKAAKMWENTITGVNQRFNNAHEFRDALRKFSIAHGFAYVLKKNDSHRVTVKCKAEGCPWRIHASRLSTTQLFCIKRMTPTHTCEGSVVTSGYQATTSWIAGIIKEKLRESPNYKPKDIADDLKRDYGIELKYAQAWRGKEIAREQLLGSYEDAYSQLPYFCGKIMETNPGSLATFSTKEDSSFQRLFISFHASLYGFNQACRPLLFLDSTPLNSKYQGTLLHATAADGNDGIFPVAFAIVDVEDDDNWRWFLIQLKEAVSTSRAITFVADIKKGLKESIPEVFENGHHSYCLRYLTENFKKVSHEVKRLLVSEFYVAAYASSLEGFRRSIDSIRCISPEACNWVLGLKRENWANTYFEGARYNHMQSNFAESFYNWVSEAHELPITQLVDVIRVKIMELIYTRRQESSQWVTRLTPVMEDALHKESIKAQSLEVLFASGSIFDVRGESVNKVDIGHGGCTCKEWQIMGLPCSHSIAVFQWVERNPYEYCATWYTTETYRSTYQESINPVPNNERPASEKDSDSAQQVVKVTPPPTRRLPGRPKMKRVVTQELAKRQLQCSKCKCLGHNKTTCKESL